MEEPSWSIRFGRLFLFKGSIFSTLDMDGRNRVYGTCGEALRYFFSVQPGQFHGGQKVPSWSFFVGRPGRAEGAAASMPSPRSPTQPFFLSYAIWTVVRTCDTPGNPRSMVPQEPGAPAYFF